MAQLSIEGFTGWLEKYGQAWRNGDAHAVVHLFSEDARYEETPFDEPMIGRDAIRRYWDEGANRSQRDVSFAFQIITVKGNTGSARWQASFYRVPSGMRVELDGVLTAEFADDGKCRSFREWWHRRESVP